MAKMAMKANRAPGYKPKGIRRKDADPQATWKEKFELCERGELKGAPEAGLIETLHQLKPDDFPETAIRWEKAATEFGKLVVGAACQLDENFFTRCAKAVQWIKQGKPLSDPLGDSILRVIVKLARIKGRGAKIHWRDVLAELDHQHPKKDGVFDERTVRKASTQLNLGSFPMDTDPVLDEYEKPPLHCSRKQQSSFEGH